MFWIASPFWERRASVGLLESSWLPVQIKRLPLIAYACRCLHCINSLGRLRTPAKQESLTEIRGNTGILWLSGIHRSADRHCRHMLSYAEDSQPFHQGLHSDFRHQGNTLHPSEDGEALPRARLLSSDAERFESLAYPTCGWRTCLAPGTPTCSTYLCQQLAGNVFIQPFC